MMTGSLRSLRAVLLATLVGAVMLAPPVVQEARADDWQVQQDRRQEIIERYKTMLESNPVEGMALNRLLGYVGRGAGLDQLIQEYRGKAERSPTRANFQLILGHLLKERGDYEEALGFYDRAVELAPNQSHGWLGRGTARLLLGERQAAMQDFEEALTRERDRQRRQDILRQLAELSFSQRDFERGKEFFGRLLAMSPRDSFLRMDYVSLLLQYRQLDEALEQYDELLRLAAGDSRQRATLLRDKAEVLEMKGDYQEALEVYGQVLRLVTASSWLAREVRERMVSVYRQAGDLVGFVETYGSSWERGARDQQVLLAEVYAEMGRLEDALRINRRLANQDRSDTETRRRIIRILERMGRDDEVPAAYADLVRAAPQRQQFAFEFAEYYMRSGDRQAAAGVLSEIGTRFRNNAYVLLELGAAYARWNFDDQARQTYDRALQIEPRDDMVIVEVGDFFFDRGERQRAMEIWERLPNSQLGRRGGTQKLAEVLVERGVLTQGIAAFQQLLAETPGDEQLLRAMARALERARRWDEALAAWTTMLEISTVRQRRQEARARIVEIHQRQNTLRAEMRRWEDAFEGGGEEAAEAGFFLVEAHLRLREFHRAEALLTALKDRPEITSEERASVLLLLEQTYVRSGQYARAIEVLEELIQERPDMQQDLLNRMADHALEARSGDAAVGYAARALEANPNDARAQARLGDVYRGAGDLEQAVVHYRTAVDIDPRAYETKLKLGIALRDLDRISEAEAILLEVVRDGREDQLITDAGEAMLAMARERGRLAALETLWAPLALRMPIQGAHSRLLMDLYTLVAGPLLLELYHGDPAGREEAQGALYALGGRATTLLVDQLQGSDVSQRGRALRLVAELQVEVASPQLRRILADPDDRMKKMALIAAARTGSPTLVPAIRAALEDGSAEVRHMAIWALGHIDSPAAQEALLEVARAGTEGTAARLAWLGLDGGQSSAVRALVATELSREISGAQRVDQEAALLLRAVESVVVAGHGENLREDLEALASTRRDQVGTWAAEVLALFGDAGAARAFWELSLAQDDRLARRGERNLLRIAAGASPQRRTVLDEVHYFDWLRGSFDAQGLLVSSSRRSFMETRGEPGELTSVVRAGLEQRLERGPVTSAGVLAMQGRIAEDLQGSRAEPFWDARRAQEVAEVILGSAGAQGLGEVEREGLALLAGDRDQIRAPAGMSTEALRALLRLIPGDAPADLWAAFLGEAMSRDDSSLKREALTGLRAGALAENGAVTGWVLGGLQDSDPLVQLAAVKAVGRLQLTQARQTLRELEVDAAPTLRRAVREALRAL